MLRKLVLYFLIPFALAGTLASLSAGLAACTGQSDAIPTSTPAPTKTITPTFTPTLDFLHMDRIPGLDPLTFAGQGEATTGERYSLPQDVFAQARSRQLAPILAEGGIASVCAADSCTVMLTDVLVSGAKLQPAIDGKVIYGFDGQAGSEALFRFSGLPEGVKATAFVSQDGNPWGYKPGTVVVWFWEGGGKGPTQVLNLDNPLQIIADAPNSISLTAIDGGLRITRTGPDGTVIDEQRVAFLPPLPDFAQETLEFPDLQFQVVDNQIIDSDGVVWFELNDAWEWERRIFTEREAFIMMDMECDPWTKKFIEGPPPDKVYFYLWELVNNEGTSLRGSNVVGEDESGNGITSCWYVEREREDGLIRMIYGVLDESTQPPTVKPKEVVVKELTLKSVWEEWPPSR